jgi:hypothetical protein
MAIARQVVPGNLKRPQISSIAIQIRHLKQVGQVHAAILEDTFGERDLQQGPRDRKAAREAGVDRAGKADVARRIGARSCRRPAALSQGAQTLSCRQRPCMLPTAVPHAIRGNDEENHSTVYVSSKPIVLLSVQRSGTNFLRRVLGSHPAIDPLFGEIFDPGHIGNELSFFHFYERAVADNPSLCLPDQRIVAFEKYIEFLDMKVQSAYYILDIKYNSIRQMESYWSKRREVLAQYMIDKQWPVIHLIRTDLVAATFSQLRARKTGIYVTKAPNYRDTYSGAVDAVQMVKGVAQRRRLIQQYRRDLAGAKILEIAYEDLIDAPNGISDFAMEKIRDFLGVTDEFSRTPATTKLITQPMSQAIENYDEVLTEAASRKVQLTMSI